MVAECERTRAIQDFDINGQLLQATFALLDQSKPFSSVEQPSQFGYSFDSNAAVRASTVHGSITNDFGMAAPWGSTLGTTWWPDWYAGRALSST